MNLVEAKQITSSKHDDLAALLKVDVNRLQTLSESTCTRLANAIRKNDYFVSQYGLTFFALRRTQNVGIKSATELCRCLGISTSLKALRMPDILPVRHAASDVAACLANMIHEKASRRRVVRHVLYAVGSPDLVVTDNEGQKFRITIETLK